MSESSDKSNQADSSAPTGENSEAAVDDNKSINFIALSESFPALNAFANSVFWFIILIVQVLADIFIQQIYFPWFVTPIIVIIAIYSAVFSYFSAKARGYAIDQFDVYFKQGIWWKKQTALNYSRIQHIDISHGPLERRFKLATIKFFTAGGMGSDLSISGLPSETAEYLRQQILKYAGDAIEEEQTSNQADTQTNTELSSEQTEQSLFEATSKETDNIEEQNTASMQTEPNNAEQNKTELEAETATKPTLNEQLELRTPESESTIKESEQPNTSDSKAKQPHPNSEQKHGSNKNDHE